MFRNLKGLTQKEMAELLHKSQSAYSRIENGEQVIGTDELKDIASVLGCEVEDLIKEQGFISILQQGGQIGPYNEQYTNDPKAFAEQYKELLQIVINHQQKTSEEMKAFVKEQQQYMAEMMKEIVAAMKKP